MNKAIKYRVYPTSEQKIVFLKTFGCCRKVWNLMLNDKIKSYEKTKSFGTFTPAMYKAEFPYLKEVDSLALANVQINLQTAFSNCFSKSRKKKNNFPKYKSRRYSRKSYTTNNQNGTVTIIDNKYIKLPKIGKVRAKIHRIPDDNWLIKSATVSCDSIGNFYISVLFEYDYIIPAINIEEPNSIGLDYSSQNLYIDSNGNKGSIHKYYRDSHRKLAKAQRKLSRRYGFRKGEVKSNNYIKQQRKVNKIYRHISNQRLDTLHKLSAKIANSKDLVCVEDLNMRSLSNKGFGNGKATLDNGYGMFISMLEYKLSDRGKTLIKVDKFYPSSQLCNCCGYKYPKLKNLSIRKWQCPNCNKTHDRDINAAINILNEGLRIYKTTYKQSVG